MSYSQLLARWEYTDDEPEVFCEGEFSYDGLLIRFELLGSEDTRFLIFRVGEDDGCWVVRTTAHLTEEADLKNAVVRALNSGSYVRTFCFGADSAQIFPYGVGSWPSSGIKPYHASFSLGKSIVKMSSSQTYAWLSFLLSHPASDIAFALRFSHSTPAKKWRQIFGFSTEEELVVARGEMNRLCQLILYSDMTLWRQESKLYWGLLASHTPHPARFWLRSLTSSKKLASAYLKKWAPAIEQFGPLPLRLNRLCGHEFIEANPRLASGELMAPSYHEQLEARLELWSWAREHLPAEVFVEIERVGG